MFQDLLQWWNLIFVLPFVASLGYLLLQAFGGIHFDHGVELDAHFDHDVGVEHDADVSPSHDSDSGDGESFILQVLSVLGVGRIPLASVLMSLCFLWGFLGWASNEIFKGYLPGFLFVWVSVGIAFVGSVILTRYLAIGIGKLMPTTETYGSSDFKLLGSVATLRYDLQPGSKGSATLFDEFKNYQEVPCRLMEGDEPMKAGDSVVLMTIDQDAGCFEVSRNPLLPKKGRENLIDG